MKKYYSDFPIAKTTSKRVYDTNNCYYYSAVSDSYQTLNIIKKVEKLPEANAKEFHAFTNENNVQNELFDEVNEGIIKELEIIQEVTENSKLFAQLYEIQYEKTQNNKEILKWIIYERLSYNLAEQIERHISRKKNFSKQKILKIFYLLLNALNDLRRLDPSLSHGNLKSNNVSISLGGDIKINDFGSSRIKFLLWKLLPTDQSPFSLNYLPPDFFDHLIDDLDDNRNNNNSNNNNNNNEKRINNNNRNDNRNEDRFSDQKSCDIYAIGIILVEMITMETPMETHKERKIQINLAIEKYPEMEKIIRGCTTEKKEERMEILQLLSHYFTYRISLADVYRCRGCSSVPKFEILPSEFYFPDFGKIFDKKNEYFSTIYYSFYDQTIEFVFQRLKKKLQFFKEELTNNYHQDSSFIIGEKLWRFSDLFSSLSGKFAIVTNITKKTLLLNYENIFPRFEYFSTCFYCDREKYFFHTISSFGITFDKLKKNIYEKVFLITKKINFEEYFQIGIKKEEMITDEDYQKSIGEKGILHLSSIYIQIDQNYQKHDLKIECLSKDHSIKNFTAENISNESKMEILSRNGFTNYEIFISNYVNPIDWLFRKYDYFQYRDWDILAIEKGTTLEEFQIFVKLLTGKTAIISVSPYFTISYIKFIIMEKEGVPLLEQRLIYAGKELSNGQTIEGSNIKSESTLHLVLRLRGSDRRLKEDIKKIGVSKDGWNIYQFRYKNDNKKELYQGVIAQELMEAKCDAVGVMRSDEWSGFLGVDYSLVDVDFLLLDTEY